MFKNIWYLFQSQWNLRSNLKFLHDNSSGVFETFAASDPRLIAFIVEVVKFHKIDIKRVKFQTTDTTGVYWNSLDDTDQHLVLSVVESFDSWWKYNIARMKFAVLHELGHVQQLTSFKMIGLGDLVLWCEGSQIVSKMHNTEIMKLWNSDIEGYSNLPQEFDANRFALSSPLLEETDDWVVVKSRRMYEYLVRKRIQNGQLGSITKSQVGTSIRS